MINNLLLTSAQPGSAAADYIEDYFGTNLYTGSGNVGAIDGSVPLASTSAWTTYKQQFGYGYGRNIAVDSSGNFYTVGTDDDGVDSRITVVKFNSSGAVQWQRKIGAGGLGWGIAVDSSGNVYVTGRTSTGAGAAVALAKYNSSGTLQWQRTLRQNTSIAYAIVIDSAGDVYLTGNANNGTYDYFITAKYDSSGTLQWQRSLRESGAYASYGRGICKDSSNNIYAFGYGGSSSATAVGMLVKYNSSGTLQWQRKIYQGFTFGFGVASDSSDNIYVVGRPNDGYEYAILAKYNSSGTLQWQRKLKNTSVAYTGYGVATDAAGNVYMCGTIIETSVTGFVVKYDSSGNFQWMRQFYDTSGGGTGTCYAYNLVADSSGNLFVTGYAIGTNGQGYAYTLKLKTDGSTNGKAFLSVFARPSDDQSGTATSANGTGADASAGATSSTGTMAEAAGVQTITSATQSEVTSSSGLVWIKGRSGATDHALYDTTRGATFDIASNLTTGQTTQTTGLGSFTATGFSIGSLAKLNTSTAIYAAWTFREKEKFFDVVTYTGNGANRTISHNLGAVPGMIIIKRTDTTGAWAVYHRSLANTEYLVLNTTAGKATGTTYWNSTTPTSTVFSLGTSTDVNANNGTYVAYLFAHDAGGFGLTGSDNVISCGSIVGPGNINLGWEPQFIIFKAASGETGPWHMFDSMRGLLADLSGNSRILKADSSQAESDYPTWISINSTGFYLGGNAGVTYIYMAIRRGPMAVPTDATKVFMPTVYTGTNVNNRLINTTIAPDMAWIRQRNSTTVGGMVVGDRLRGQPYLVTGTNANEVTSATALDQQIVSSTQYGTAFSSMNGVWVGNDATAQLNVSTTASNQVAEAFKRAPGFFDVVCYSGNSSTQNVSHNLTVVPELIFVKKRSGTAGLFGSIVYNSTIGSSNYLLLNSTAGSASAAIFGTPTSSYFALQSSANANETGNSYVAYLFATCPGISKVGSYTGTGTTKQVDCGFTSGARLVLIKRTDSTGDWYIYDTARGIVAGNDPYLLLNSTAAEVTSTDYVDAYSAGFELSSTAPAGLNANGGTFIFLAIA